MPARLRAYTVVFPLATLLIITFAIYAMIARTSPARSEDFKTFLAAASLFDGHHNPYNLPAMLQRQQQLFRVNGGAGMWAAKNPYVDGPLLLVLLRPLTALPWRAAYVLWDGVLLLSIIVATLLTIRIWSEKRLRVLSLILVVSPPIFLNLLLGQPDGLLLLVLAVALVCQDRGCSFIAGVLLSVGLIKPQIMVGAALLLAIQAYERRALWRYAAGGLVGAAVAALVASLLGGPAIMFEWIQALFGFGSAFAPVQVNISSLSVFYIGWAPQALTVVTIIGAGVWLIGVTIAWRRSDHSPSSTARWIGIGMTGWLLVTPYAHPHDDIVLVSAFAAFSTITGRPRVWMLYSAISALMWATWWLFPIPYLSVLFAHIPSNFQERGLGVVPILLLLTLLVWPRKRLFSRR